MQLKLSEHELVFTPLYELAPTSSAASLGLEVEGIGSHHHHNSFMEKSTKLLVTVSSSSLQDLLGFICVFNNMI